MAKKSISDIVLRAVVDTSGVAAGLNNVQAQVAGRRFGTVGGPQGATGAAGGFVSPHGGGAGPGVAAVAAAAAFGAGIGRGGGGSRLSELIANRASVPASMQAALGRMQAVRGNPVTDLLFRRFQTPLFERANRLYDAANVAREAGSRTAQGIYASQAAVLRERYNRRQQALANFAQSRIGRMAGGAYGALGAVGRGADALGAGLNRFGGMLGLGRFAPLGGAGLAIGGLALGGMAVARMADRTRQGFSDISRFQVGPDRATAAAISRTWNPPGQKAPIGAWERFLISARQANAGQTTWIERATRGAEQALFEQLPSQLGRASQGDLGALVEYNPAISGIAGSFFSNGALSPTAMFNTLRRLMA